MEEFIFQNYFDERIKRLVKREYLQPVIDEIKAKLIQELDSLCKCATRDEIEEDPYMVEYIIRRLVKFTPLSNGYSSSYIEPGWDRCRELLNIYYSIKTTD